MAKIPYITLSDTINTSRLRINQLIDSVGDLALLTTGDSGTIVGAINFLDSNAGRKTALTTTAKTSIVAGINEHDTELGTITTAAMKVKGTASTVSGALAAISDSIGSGPLTTTVKTLVGAINEHDTELGTITAAAMKARLGASTVSAAIAEIHDSIGSGALTTTTKNLVGAINEHDTELGTITSAAMKTKLGASTVSGALAAISDSIGSGSLTTTTKTLVGAINEHDVELGTITTAAMKVKGTASTVSGALAAISDSIGSGPLTTTTKTLVGAINEHDVELGTITAAAMKTKLGASTVSTAIAGINDSIGYGVLKTDAKTVIGSLNEIQDSIGYGGLNTTAKTLVGAINELQDSIGTGGLNTTTKTLIGAINEIEDSIGRGGLNTVPKNLVGAINFLDSNAGRKANLTAGIERQTLVNAINFVDSNAGRKANLTTSVKTNLAAAINSVKDSSAAVTGSLGLLSTTIKSNLVNAINFLDSNAGRKASLTTTSKTSIVAGINELDTELGTITAAAMKTRGGASTVSTAIAQIYDSIGTATLTTTTKTLIGAINEHDTELGTITAAAMKTRRGASTVSTAIAQIFDSIGTATLATTAKTLVGAINELDLRLDSVEAAIVDSAGQLLLKSNGNLAARFTNSNVQFQGFVTSTTALSTSQQDYSGAINELKTTIDTITGAVSVDSGISNTVGSLSNLSTPITSTIVAAINFLDSNAGDKTSLNTTSKTSIVAGVNELKGRLDSVNGGISNTMIRSDAIITSKILNNNVTFAKLPLATTAKRVIASTASGAIYSEQQVDSDMLGGLSVSAAKLQSNAVTTAKMADSAVSTSKIQLNAVTTAKILDLNVTTGKLANNAVTFPKMQLSSVANRVVGATSAGSQLGEVQISSAMIAAGAVDSAALKANTVTLGTKTTGNYVATIAAGTGVSFSAGAGTGAGSTPTIAIGQAVGTTSNVTFNDVIVSGNLTISGTTTSINTETITLNDNIIVLNNNATGVPTQNAGIEIERGDSANVLIRWNEATNRWGFTNDGTNYHNIPTFDEYIDSATSKYPTTYTWTGGTTAGPTGSLTGNNLTAISFGAIPSAGAGASGIITTGAQTIAGAKTFSSTITGSIDGNAGTVTNGFYTTSSFNLGTTSIAVNRASGAQTLTGVSIDGNAGTATSVATLTNTRTFSITGDVLATAQNFNGSQNVALTASIVDGSVDSAALGSLAVSGAKLQAGAVSSGKLASAVTLIIYNSAGTALKTLYGAGA
jgi:hypothetical protein